MLIRGYSKIMNLILVGPPGVGKGSQAKILAKKLNIPHISTGDMFRMHFKHDTDLGRLAKSFTEKGLLVPDEVTNQMVVDRLREADVKNGFILDGYPRNISQAQFLDQLLKTKDWKIDWVVNITALEKVLVRRITGRRVCPVCETIYHLDTHPPQVAGICDKDGHQIIQRTDDTEEIVKDRLHIYETETFPLISYYQAHGIIIDINGDKLINQVTLDILKVLGE